MKSQILCINFHQQSSVLGWYNNNIFIDIIMYMCLYFYKSVCLLYSFCFIVYVM